MAEYQESNITGTSYQRGRTLIFENPRQGTPSLLIKEERVTLLANNRVILESAGEIRKIVEDMTPTFALRNPATNEIIEGQTASYQDLYVLLFSLYWHLANERDAQS